MISRRVALQATTPAPAINCSSLNPSSWAAAPNGGGRLQQNTSMFSRDTLKCNATSINFCPIYPGWATFFTTELSWTLSNNLEHVGRASGPLKINSISFLPNINAPTSVGLWCADS